VILNYEGFFWINWFNSAYSQKIAYLDPWVFNNFVSRLHQLRDPVETYPKDLHDEQAVNSQTTPFKESF